MKYFFEINSNEVQLVIYNVVLNLPENGFDRFSAGILTCSWSSTWSRNAAAGQHSWTHNNLRSTGDGLCFCCSGVLHTHHLWSWTRGQLPHRCTLHSESPPIF